ncbi:CPBP family intramembrane glutamic endopeptidase [Gracilimonas sp.]|uniref:CPBP family intramembrane glutamic endopeptidase n=1 Tax=Gracilimonas sp. TaxID=1974203 RepID=UPI0028712118|nr:type II CAAX endopeptidase family protein [Gracilimonas sp.]
MDSTNKTISKKKQLTVFIATVIFGFILFALPNVFFGVTKINGGLIGVNLLFIAVFQLITVCWLLYFSLRFLGKDFKYIGWSFEYWKADGLLGIIIGLTWTVLQFGVIIPNTGGAERTDISQMVTMFDGSVIGTFSFVALGVIGGGITEEIYNRGYFINVLKDMFSNPKVGIWIAAILSILFFAAGHLPSDALGWFDILVPTIAYTLLFLYTKRLTASMVAHGVYNMTAILFTYYMFY